MNSYYKRRGTKYKSKTCKCLLGHWHHSRGEAEHCNKLSLLKKTGYITEFETQKKFSFDINGKHICNHYVDFWITGNSGEQWVEEFKGMATPEWKLKKKLFEALFPDIKYKVVYYK